MVSDSDMKRYYQEHRDRFALPEEYTLSQILIKPTSPDEMATPRPRHGKIVALLKQGESFEDLALRYSDGSTPRAADGWAWSGRANCSRPRTRRRETRPRRHLRYH